MITALLTIVVTWCLFYGRMATPGLILLCVAAGGFLLVFGRHSHVQLSSIDVLAQISPLSRLNAGLKCAVLLLLMVLCIAAQSPLVGLVLCLTATAMIIGAAGLKLADYLHLFALPLAFLMLSGLALLFEISPEPFGAIRIHLGSVWLCVGAEAQLRAELVIARALGAVSCMYLLSLTTPMAEIIGVLRKIRCPKVITELMYLIYRYIFVLFSLYHTMHEAAESRHGFKNLKTSFRVTGNILANLLARSYRMATVSFDAMESRGYQSDIRFLETKKPIAWPEAFIAVALVALFGTLSMLLR